MKDIITYAVEVKGKAISSWSGSVPENIDKLINKTPKDTVTLMFEVVKTQVELLLQQGKTAEAMEAIHAYLNKEFVYPCPLNTFRRDEQNGRCLYQGAHSFYGAFRDTAGKLYDLYYQKKGDLQAGKASDKHLRDSVVIYPNHVFLYRDGKKIVTPDDIEGQQPTEDVSGFSKYEVIHPPFEFAYTVHVLAKGPFQKFLEDKDRVVQSLKYSSLRGQGSRRSANYGHWEPVSVKIKDWSIN